MEEEKPVDNSGYGYICWEGIKNLPIEKHLALLESLLGWAEQYEFWDFVEYFKTINQTQREELAIKFSMERARYFYSYNSFEICPMTDFNKEVLWIGCIVTFTHNNLKKSFQEMVTPTLPKSKIYRIYKAFNTDSFQADIKRSLEKYGI